MKLPEANTKSLHLSINYRGLNKKCRIIILLSYCESKPRDFSTNTNENMASYGSFQKTLKPIALL